MIGRLIVAGALGVAVSATGALAADLAPAPVPAPAEPAQTCDFFQAQLIGLLCGRTAYVAPGVHGDGETIESTTSVAPAPPAPGGQLAQKWDYKNISESMTLAVSPWQGVRFYATGEALQYDNTYSSQFTPTGGGLPTSTNLSASGSIAGWEGVGGAATLWDTHLNTPFGNVHYLLNIVGGVQFFPGGGPYPGRDLQQIGWQSGAQLPLGGTGLSLNYLATNLVQHFDNPGLYDLQNTTRVLLASDAYGWAVGPVLGGATVLWHAPGSNTGWFSTQLGGEALLQPFRRTSIPVLRDLTLDLAATHSLGQAALVPDWAGSASSYIYSAEARFNFSF
jgi:hypothetical protein